MVTFKCMQGIEFKLEIQFRAENIIKINSKLCYVHVKYTGNTF